MDDQEKQNQHCYCCCCFYHHAHDDNNNSVLSGLPQHPLCVGASVFWCDAPYAADQWAGLTTERPVGEWCVWSHYIFSWEWWPLLHTHTHTHITHGQVSVTSNTCCNSCPSTCHELLCCWSARRIVLVATCWPTQCASSSPHHCESASLFDSWQREEQLCEQQ